MKYRVLQPFIAFGKTPQAGEIVDLTDEQAKLLDGMDNIAPYETKVMAKPENKTVKKSSGSSRPARQRPKRIRKISRQHVKK